MGRGRLSSSKKKQSRKKRTDGLRRRVSSHISKGSLDKKSIMTGVSDCSSIANLAIHGGRLIPNFPIKRANHENSFLLTKISEQVSQADEIFKARDHWIRRLLHQAYLIETPSPIPLSTEVLRRHGLIQLLYLIVNVMMTTKESLTLLYL
ncbi:uncharacterized protein G2W53_010222 [Senna tora]|uniref:Uncharacterized protein n=1 Tax=Senna tora TaxID=362788 RepID=A0A834X0N7_9FABA|nr:uncharacterized protein G2W53_010222 [Senna tora]